VNGGDLVIKKVKGAHAKHIHRNKEASITQLGRDTLAGKSTWLGISQECLSTNVCSMENEQGELEVCMQL